MSRRIDIELTSSRDDGSWTWRAAGAREPRGTLDGAVLPPGVQVGDVVRAEIEAYLDGMSVVGVVPPRSPRSEPERLEIKASSADGPLVTTTLARKGRGDRGDRRRRERGERGERERRDGRRGRPERQDARHARADRPTAPPADAKPKPRRLRPGRAHRNALLEALPAEQRPVAEQVLQGGIPSVRQAIDKQNEQLRAEGKPEVRPDALLKVAEDLRPRALAALWRDRAEAAVASVDEIDLRDLRSVVNAAGDAGRDDEARALAEQLRGALTTRLEKEHAGWLAELADALRDGRVVRALRLSSRPPKAGAPIPGDLSNQLVEATSAALTDETGSERWATVLDALAYSPVRRRVVPRSLPAKLSDDLRKTIARLGTRLPEIAHIFDVEPEAAPARGAGRPARRKGPKAGEAEGGSRRRGSKRPRGRSGADKSSEDRSSEARSDADRSSEAKSRDDKSSEAGSGADQPSEDRSSDESAGTTGPPEAADGGGTDAPRSTAAPATTDDTDIREETDTREETDSSSDAP